MDNITYRNIFPIIWTYANTLCLYCCFHDTEEKMKQQKTTPTEKSGKNKWFSPDLWRGVGGIKHYSALI